MNPTIKINLRKIDQNYVFKGEKGDYVDLILFPSDDRFGKGVTHTVMQSIPKEARDRGVKGNYVGDAKLHEKDPQEPAPQSHPVDDRPPF